MKKIRTSMLISIVAVFFLLLISSTWLYFPARHQSAPKQDPISVAVIKVAANDYQPTLEAIGTLQANQGTILKAQTDGQVVSINFSPGTDVQVGTVLVVQNNVQQRGALDAALAQQKLNYVMYQRDLALKKIGAISLAVVDQAQAAVDAGQAAVYEAQGAYDVTLVKAPFAGRVGISKINIGDYLQSATPIVSLQNLDPLFVDFYVPEKSFSLIKTGEIVKIVAQALPDKTFIGKIISYETVIDTNTGMLQIRAAVPNSQQVLLPGGYASVQVVLGPKQNTLIIPQTALMYDSTGPYVYVIQADQVVRQNVTLGVQIEQSMQIMQGLKPGDIVVSAGTNKVHPGSVVQARYE